MGATRIAGTWRTTARADDVWAVVVDLETWPEWWPAIQDVELLDGEPGAPDAARFVFDTPSRLPPLRVQLRVTRRTAPSHLVVVCDDGPLTGEGSLTVSTEDGGTSTSFDLRLQVRSLVLKPLDAVLAGATRAGGTQRLAAAGDDLARLAGGEPLPHRL